MDSVASKKDQIDSADSETNDESMDEDQNQRKRTRVRSHADEDTSNKAADTLNVELSSKKDSVEQSVMDLPPKSLNTDTRAPIKRPRLHVEGEGLTDESSRTSANNESKDSSLIVTDDDDDDDDDDEDDDDEDEDEDEDENESEYINDDDFKDVDGIVPATKPSLYSAIRNRELGMDYCRRINGTCRVFHNQAISNRQLIQTFTVSHTLDGHNGCVNALSFNRTGTLLASGSDDLQVMLWDWATDQVAAAYESDHYSNVFQTKFVPYSSDCKIITCARDGQVRLGELRPDGSLIKTKKLVEHRASAHKLVIDNIVGNDVFSCGEDSLVYHIDLREQKAHKLLSVRSEQDTILSLYSIDLNRNNQNEFILSGTDPYIRLYDRRSIETPSSKPMKSFCPDMIKKIENRQQQPSVTSAVYNYNGSEILGSYNDEDIYLFDATHSDGADAIHRYRGHRNNSTVKGVNFYGQNSEYIISGSDCGNVFIWDKPTEKCIWFARGDYEGTVNVLEPHPHFPVIATSGLDHDIKIWQPTEHSPIDFKRLRSIMKRNARQRQDELQYASVFDHDTGDLLRLMRPVFRRIVRRVNSNTEPNGQEGNGDEDEDDDDDDDDGDENENDRNRRHRQLYSLDCAPS